jgi:hypothetical protein
LRRLTEAGLTRLIRRTGFDGVSIHAQGFYLTVLLDMLRAGLARLRPSLLRWGLGAIFLPLAAVLRHVEARWSASPFICSYPGGYFATARRPSPGTIPAGTLSPKSEDSVRAGPRPVAGSQSPAT